MPLTVIVNCVILVSLPEASGSDRALWVQLPWVLLSSSEWLQVLMRVPSVSVMVQSHPLGTACCVEDAPRGWGLVQALHSAWESGPGSAGESSWMLVKVPEG